MTEAAPDRDSGDNPFSELGEPVLAVADRPRGLLAVAGAHQYGEAATVGVFDVTDRARRRRLLRSKYPVHAMAFHPTRPLLAVGSGAYDGGYFFEGELLLVHLKTGAVRSLIGHASGRQVLGLKWLNDRDLRVLTAPHDDDKDPAAHEEGHVAVVGRADWTTVGARSLTGHDLAGPRSPVVRPNGRKAARRLVARWTPP